MVFFRRTTADSPTEIALLPGAVVTSAVVVSLVSVSLLLSMVLVSLLLRTLLLSLWVSASLLLRGAVVPETVAMMSSVEIAGAERGGARHAQ